MSGGYATVNGTSFSTPMTAAVLALMWSANPTLSNLDVEQLLFETAVDLGEPGKDIYFGHGRIDAAAAVAAAKAATPTTDTTPPTVAITNPVSGISVSSLIPVDVTANDDKAVSRVELKVNGTTIATDTSAPYSFIFDTTTVSNGSTNLTAVAYDTSDNNTTSNPVTININNTTTPPPPTDTTPPEITITNPTSGSVSGSVTITTEATDDSGAANLTLSIYVDNTLLATGSGGTLSTTWNTKSKSVTAGTHTIKATATDKAGNTNQTTVTVEVVKGGGGKDGGGTGGGGGKGKNR